MRRYVACLALALASVAFAQYSGAPRPPADLRPGFDSIRETDARQTLGYLAGSETQGRGTGQPGFQLAADFMAEKFKAAGLKPLGENGTYFQYGTFYRPEVASASLTLGTGKTIEGGLLALAPVGRDLDVSGEIALVRGGANDRLSDEEAKSLDGKIVIALIPEGRSGLRSQINLADAKAVFTVDRVPTADVPAISRSAESPSSSDWTKGEIATETLVMLGPQAGAFVAQAQAGASVFVVPGSAHLVAKESMRAVRVPNVVGMIEGSDRVLKDQYVGIGAHLDHLGVRNGVVYPGADDDGSGSTALTLVAQAVAANRVKPKRSLVFMAFFGEEMGLLGSKLLTDHPPVPLDKMVAEIQMDMVGRDSEGVQNGDESRVDVRDENVDTLRLVGSKRISTDLDAAIQEMNKYVGFKFKYDAEDVYTRSDHYNFAAKGVPIAFFFDGFHPDYHQPTDTVDKIDFTKLTNAARLAYLSVMKVANDPTAPRKDVPQEK